MSVAGPGLPPSTPPAHHDPLFGSHVTNFDPLVAAHSSTEGPPGLFAMESPSHGPQQPSSLNSHPATASPNFSRQIQPQDSSRTSRSAPANSPNSNRRSSRRADATNQTTPNTPQQSFTASPPSTRTTPRTLPQPPVASPTSQDLDLTQPAYGAPVPPPRTSSNQRVQEEVTTSDRPSSSRGQPRGSSNQTPYDQNRDRSQDDNFNSPSSARSRKRQQESARQDGPQRASSTRESSGRYNPHTAQATSSPTMNSTIPREDSAVLNRIVVTDSQVDVVRERERIAETEPLPPSADLSPTGGLAVVGSQGVDDSTRIRSRQDHSATATSSRRKDVKFGEYILGQTLGEGEFGKVKMGWKRDGGVQVAIKLIRKESLGTNPSRLPKIYREISILQGLSHPNIVRLHEMVETERHIGIILEYASGGELFDFILNNRYLKDSSARQLFAQLVSGVGYLHKKGIVHRDLKLENLLLDRNRNIIITDFGFANTFDPADELGEDVEKDLANKDFVRRKGLDRILDNGLRRGDLMQTSCGSPCYAAPELVVSDSLYTGRKVDVWSCGVILYAMLAGYLPFDDDPANPEGDNINLLYKYIVSTPLTFPEYVTPHARDLLRRILVPDPRKRADLFEVARHSWLSDYAHVVAFITSGVTTTKDIANSTIPSDDRSDGPLLARSASVREPGKSHQSHIPAVGGLIQKHGQVDAESQAAQQRTAREAKRRTVQLEYVPPQSQTARGEMSPIDDQPSTSRIDPSRSQMPTKPLPQDPPVSPDTRRRQTQQQPSPQQTRSKQPSSQQPASPPSWKGKEPPRSVSDNTGSYVGPSAAGRPATGGSMSSHDARLGSSRLPPSRGSYSRPVQPAAPAVQATNAHGRLAQPKGGKPYVISAPIPASPNALEGGNRDRPNTSATTTARRTDRPRPVSQSFPVRSHKRSSTIGGISERLFGKTGSIFGGKTDKSYQQEPQQKTYPPTSMPTGRFTSRTSTDSKRSSSYGFGGRNGSAGGGDKSRRFSLLPFRLGSSSGPKDSPPPTTAASVDYKEPYRNQDDEDFDQPPNKLFTQSQPRPSSNGRKESAVLGLDGRYDAKSGTLVDLPPVPQERVPRYSNQDYLSDRKISSQQYMDDQYPSASEGSIVRHQQQQQQQQRSERYPDGFNSDEDQGRPSRSGHGPNVLQKNHRKFTDAYEQEQRGNYVQNAPHSGSSGAARKVMDFFRRRGRARAGDDR
ncbi:MAG: hypothetical protein M1814_001170 [Vezdaea aestivalis]|nr:MAG: hypothetical protein M1814_001170 [Vezdaea aestivalis]